MTKKQEVIIYFKNKIKNGDLKPGDKLLSEEDYSLKLKVSRNTIRSAFNVLEKENLIIRRHGSGTFITKTNSDKKYILIVSDDYSAKGVIRKTYRFLFQTFNKYIIEKGYKPIYFVANNIIDLKNSISEIKNEIAGAIIYTTNEKDKNYIISCNIPCVEVLKLIPSTLPNITIDYLTLYKETEKILNKIKSNNILIFSIKRANMENKNAHFIYGSFPFIIEDELFSKYNLYLLNYSYENNSAEKEIEEILKNTTKKPDMVVFLDDNLFKIAYDYFEEYPNIFKNTPILTQSNANWTYKGNYDITRIEFNFFEVGRETINILDNLINNRPMIEYSKIIKPHLIPSEKK